MVGVKLYVRLVVGLIRRILPVQDPSNDMIAIKIRAKGSEWRTDVSIGNRTGRWTLRCGIWSDVRGLENSCMHGDSGDMQPRRMQGKVECVPANQMLHALVCGAEICVAIELSKNLAVHVPSQAIAVQALLCMESSYHKFPWLFSVR